MNEDAKLAGQTSGAGTQASPDRDVLLAAYSVASDQNKLYAGFRWKVLSFLSTLEAALVYATAQATGLGARVLYCVAGILVTCFLLALEERHHRIYKETRGAAREIESRLGLGTAGAFSAIKRKKELRFVERIKEGHHNLLVRVWCLLLVIGWAIALLLLFFRVIR